MMEERGLSMAHTTILRWVYQYGTELDKRVRRHLRPTNIPDGMQLRQQKYLNNILEQDHRFIKKRVRSMLGLKTFRTAKQIIYGVEVMHMLKKGQLQQGVKSVQSEIEFIHKLFGVVS